MNRAYIMEVFTIKPEPCDHYDDNFIILISTVCSRPYLVRLSLCYSVASVVVVVCMPSVRNVLWLNGAS